MKDKGRVITEPRESRRKKILSTTSPTLYECCWQCRFSLEFKDYLWCKRHQKQVKKKDTCENFFGYSKRVYVKEVSGRQRHKKSKGKR